MRVLVSRLKQHAATNARPPVERPHLARALGTPALGAPTRPEPGPTPSDRAVRGELGLSPPALLV